MLPASLQKYFWDTDFAALDEVVHKKYIIERLLEWGDDEAVHWLRTHYSATDLRQINTSSRQLSLKSRNYWQLILN